MPRPFLLLAFSLLTLLAFAIPAPSHATEKPNFVLVFVDDQGYGDLGCYGSETIRTPNIDRLAKEGRRFTSFVVASPVCTPSRAALLTGCYPKRVGMHQHVLFPGSNYGLNPEEHTIADHLKAQGYATACFGKWHLGHHPETLPRAQGFDRYFGIPYSNDMNHPDNQGKPQGGPEGMDLLWNDPESTLTKWNTPLIENEEIVELPVDQRTITRRTTDRAVEFIKENRDRPFFLYLPHSMPHIPLYVPDEVRDPDPKRAYINTIEHIDTETGRVFDAIRELGLSEKTYVIYTTDNGPWLSFKHHGGSAGPLRDGKGTTFEGGQRVPFIVSRPGTIPAGTVCDEFVASIDLLPTFAALTGTPLPAEGKIDGVDISALFIGDGKSPREEFLYYTSRGALEGIRQGDWKLLIKRPDEGRGNQGKGGDKAKAKQKSAKEKEAGEGSARPQTLLFHLGDDLGERKNLAMENPDIVTRLEARMRELDAEIEANAREPWRKG